MVWKPRVTVAAVIEDAGRFLLVEERVRGELVLNQPAGHLEENESLLEAVVRETLEETSYHFVPEYLTGCYQWRAPSGSTFLRFAFGGLVTGEDSLRELDTDIERALWLDERNIANAPNQRSPLVQHCIDDYLAGKRFPLDLITTLEP